MKTYSKRHLLSIVTIGMLMSLANGCQRRDNNALQDSTSTSIVRKPKLNTIYYGTTTDNIGETRAWLIYIDSIGQCSIYDPPGTSSVTYQAIDSNGQITFKASMSRESYFDFVGKFIENEIRGTVILYDSITKFGPLKSDLVLSELPNQDSASKSLKVYSGLQYIEESGDLHGFEIALLKWSDKPVFTFTSSDEVFRLLSPVKITRKKDTVSFDIRSITVGVAQRELFPYHLDFYFDKDTLLLKDPANLTPKYKLVPIGNLKDVLRLHKSG